VSVPEKLLGASALIMALCCALLPLAGAALGGGLIAGAGTVGLSTGAVGLAASLRGDPTPQPRPPMLTAADTAVGKKLVRRLVDEVVNAGDLSALDEISTAPMARAAARWMEPFRQAFPDFRMEIVQLVAESDTVVARFRCSGTHLGEWRGHAPTGRRFERIDEVYFFEVRDGRLARAWGLEDTLTRSRQLGLPE
jgi:predicted ester cyclase